MTDAITPEEIERLDRLSIYQKTALVGLWLRQKEGNAKHLWHPNEDDVFACPSQYWRDYFGSFDKKIRDICTVRVDENFSVRKGVCQAYVWRNGIDEIVERWIGLLEKSTPEYHPKDCDVRCVPLNRANLEARAESGHLGCMAILRAAHIDEYDPRFAYIYEHYGRAGGKETGREFVRGVGLQQLSESLRQELSEGTNTVSVDMVNCAPNLLTQIVDVHLPAVSQLANHREECLSLFMGGFGFPRGVAKRWALAMMGGATLDRQTFRALEQQGTPLTCMDSSKQEAAREFSTMFSADIHHAASRVCEMNGVCPDGRERFRYLALKIQEAEDQILRACIKYHELRGEEVTVLIFDGYYVRGLEWVDSVDLEALSAFVYAETGYRVSFAQKAIDGRLVLAA